MSAEIENDPTTGGFNGLKRLERTLPSSWYYDPAQYARELRDVWYRHWVYLCRAATLPEVQSYRTFTLGTQPLLVLRDEAGELRAYFNTCRHRGAMLCPEPEGRLPAKAITCPYHAWTYRLSGELARIPSMGRPHHVPQGEVSLYAVPIRVWRGFVYVNLGDPSRGWSENFNANTEQFANWPLEDLVPGHQTTRLLKANWKVFWENYNECLHCPGVHPNLSSLVPIYKRGIMEQRDDPNWQAQAESTDPAQRGGLRPGAATWSVDGRSLGHDFPLTAEERRIGYHYMTSLPSHYLVLHVDHVRSTRLMPVGPEETELSVEWLFPKSALSDPAVDPRRSIDFSAEVLAEDAAICEVAQRGLRAQAHERGYLMPEEYDVYRFNQWLRAALAPT